MINFGRFLPFRRSRRDDNVIGSIGDRKGVVGKKKHTCWQAIGPVRSAWNTLRPKIKDYIETSFQHGPALSLEIYIIGRTESSAKATILVCSPNEAFRKAVRRSIEGSVIMEDYPYIGLGDTSRLPDLLAQEDIQPVFQPSQNSANETLVFSSPLDNSFGRRLYISNPATGVFRPATAGPILHINGQSYQLTVGHAFLDSSEPSLLQPQTSNYDDCDFDGQSDSENDDYSANFKKVHQVPLSKNRNTDGLERISRPQDNLTERPGPYSSTTDQILPLQLPLVSMKKPSTEHIGHSQLARPLLSRTLDLTGKLAFHSELGSRQCLDYALVKLEDKYRNDNNEIACGPNGIQRWLRVVKAADIGSGDVNIVTVTASSGFLSGKLCATASYMRLPNQRTLQEVYPIHLNGILSHGDCGSSVIDQSLGHLYGHIVAGNLGTGYAYIVPAIQVFEDISRRFRGDITLVRPKKSSRSNRFSADPTELEPLRVVEFASKEYFSDMKKTVHSDEDHSRSNISSPVATRSQTHPWDRKRASWGGGNAPSTQSNSKQSRLIESIDIFRFKNLVLDVEKLKPLNETSNVGILYGREAEVTDMRSTFNFEQHFFALPSDLQTQIFACLDVPDIVNLRMASRHWHNLITLNETPITRLFLEYNSIPPFATTLYPPPDSREINLHYICGIWHRLVVASSLSAAMADWIIGEFYLRRTEKERLEFSPYEIRIRHRLLPLLFTAFHFFEEYRRLHIKRLLENGYGLLREAYTINPIESQIMEIYENPTLLQVHQVFPLLVAYLCRRFRPPSYLGHVERSLRGYGRGPPPDHVFVALFCLGGLKNGLRLSEIGPYDLRRIAVDDWYASLSPEQTRSVSRTRRWSKGLGRRHSKQIASERTEKPTKIEPSTTRDILPGLGSGNLHNREAKSASTINPLLASSLAAGPPMAPLPEAQASLLLADLPILQDLWVVTAEATLLERQAVERPQDIKRDAQFLQELIRGDITDADELFYGEES
jgi:hypothetical protein